MGHAHRSNGLVKLHFVLANKPASDVDIGQQCLRFLVESVLLDKLCQISVKHMRETEKAITLCACVCATMKKPAIEEEGGGVMSKLRKKERKKEMRDLGTWTLLCRNVFHLKLIVFDLVCPLLLNAV